MARTRIRLAQNFLTDPRLVSYVVAQSSISREDAVLEIGPGAGIITAALAGIARKVIAVEADATLANTLRKCMKSQPNVRVHHSDILRFRIDEPEFKVFSNIPFNITADIMRKLLTSEALSDAYLIVQKEAAEKYSGTPLETEVSVIAKPWFEFSIMHEFDANDFDPAPSVDVVLLRILRRDEPLLPPGSRDEYRQFVRYGYRAAKKNLKIAYKNIFSFMQWKRLSTDLSFGLKATPSELNCEQWIGLFNYYLVGVSPDKKALLNSRSFPRF